MSNSTPTTIDNKWHTLTVPQVFDILSTSPQGLSSEEVAARLTKYGPNILQFKNKTSAFKIFIQQFKSVLVLLLLAAALVSGLLGHTTEAVAIAIIVFLSILLGFIQEWRAEKSLEALGEMAAPTATVIRASQETKIKAAEAVPGDIIVLTAGDKVPADARVVESFSLKADEASLTGESVPVEKHINTLAENISLGDKQNLVLAGTIITYGRGLACVVATGNKTEFGKIADMLTRVEVSITPLQKSLNKLSTRLGQASLVVIAIMVVLGFWQGREIFDSLIFGIALAVAAVPEALPAVVTISLALGVQRMVKRNVLVRHLPAVEALGGVQVICTDKTGTLTRNEMTVSALWCDGREIKVGGVGYEPKGAFMDDSGKTLTADPILREMLQVAVLCSDAKLVEEQGSFIIKGDPTEGALVVAGAKFGLLKEFLDQEYPRQSEIPFTSESKRMTTLHKTSVGFLASTKGAPEIILKACDKWLSINGEVVLTDDVRDNILQVAQKLAKRGLRVMGIAEKKNEADINQAEKGMVFLGLVGMIDPARPEVKAAIEVCRTAGIKPVMITGDHPITAESIGRELGLIDGGQIITGVELDAMSDEELFNQVDKIEIYARVSPTHKLRVVEAWQKRGFIVAMTGDGVNDAPALKRADVGLAMGITGTDVTREAAAVTLTDDNFASIVAGVEEGRVIYSNIKKYLTYLLSSNIGEIGLVVGAVLLGFPLPLSAVQLLFINLVTDGAPALALAVDPAENNVMKQVVNSKRKQILDRPTIWLMLIGAAWSTIISLSLFIGLIITEYSLLHAMTIAFVSTILIHFVKAYSFRRPHGSQSGSLFNNKWLNWSIVLEMILLLILMAVPTFQGWLGIVSLSLFDWLLVSATALTVYPVLALVKKMQGSLVVSQ